MKEQEIQSSMNKSVEATQRNFNTIRTGRANASLLDRISVEYYGSETPIKSLASISIIDSQTISIQPFDISCLQAIEKAISSSDLGITPNNDGKVIRINVPPLTEERRKEFCKLASNYAEEGKVALRNIRRDAVDKEKRDEKEGLISPNLSFSMIKTEYPFFDKFRVVADPDRPPPMIITSKSFKLLVFLSLFQII